MIVEEKPPLMLFYYIDYRSANSHPIFSPIGLLIKILERFCRISTWDTVTHDSEVRSTKEKMNLSVYGRATYIPNFSPIGAVEKFLWLGQEQKKK